MGVAPMYKTKECKCGCGRVGKFHTYASNACRQRAFRQRQKKHIDLKAKSVSSMLIDIFGADNLKIVFAELNQIPGDKSCKHIENALEQLVYLIQHEINKSARKGRRIS